MSFESPRPVSVDEKSFRHDLIQKEFRALLENSDYKVPDNTEAVIILSGPPAEVEGENLEDENRKTPENLARIEFGIDVYRKITAQRLGKKVEQLTNEELKNKDLPFLILSGEIEQIPSMRNIAINDLHFPMEKIREIPCGNIGGANTKTQMETFTADSQLAGAQHITLITTSYHSPRVARTASKVLNKEVGFDVLGVPLKDFPFDVYRKVKGEVKRIIAYSKKGDIAKFSRNRDKSYE